MSPNTFITIIIKGPSLPTQNTLVGSFIGCQSWQSGRTALLLLLLWGSGGRREAHPREHAEKCGFVPQVDPPIISTMKIPKTV